MTRRSGSCRSNQRDIWGTVSWVTSSAGISTRRRRTPCESTIMKPTYPSGGNGSLQTPRARMFTDRLLAGVIRPVTKLGSGSNGLLPSNISPREKAASRSSSACLSRAFRISSSCRWSSLNTPASLRYLFGNLLEGLSRWQAVAAGALILTACGGGRDEPIAPFPVTVDVGGVWDLRAVIPSRYPGSGTGTCVLLHQQTKCSSDTITVAVVTGPLTLGLAPPNLGVNSLRIVTGASVSGLLYETPDRSVVPPCSGKPLSCWQQYGPRALAPTVTDGLDVAFAEGRFAYGLSLSLNLPPVSGTYQVYSVRVSWIEASQRPVRLYDSSSAGVFELTRR